MMPGETPPAVTAAGLGAEAAAAACANCGALQQNVNEYVAALIALKQKIIDTDHLLTEYQQKCNELQFAERENNTLRNQVEQMFQKISPLEKCQEELGSVKAELEEKKSSLKIYQETHLEYVRVKQEMNKSDAMKKKLEAKVKKLEEAAGKHIQEFKQLKADKKVLEKELKKAQEKIEGFPNAKQKKVLKHAETQSERESPVANLDKEKIKLLLEELWLCIDSSTGKNQINKNDYLLVNYHENSRTRGKTKTMQNRKQFKRHQGERSSHSSPETQTSLTSLQIKLDSKPTGYGSPIENSAMEISEACKSSIYEDGSQEVAQSDIDKISVDLCDKEQEELAENLQDVLKCVRPLPPLLSPIQFSPAATPDTLFEDLTDSSDEEMDQDAEMLERILGKCDQDEPMAEMLPKDHSAELQSNCNSLGVNNASRGPQESPETLRALKKEETILHSDPLTVSESNAKSKDEVKHLGENSESMEIETSPKIVIHCTEDLNEKVVNMIKTEDKSLVPDLVSGTFSQRQEKTAEPVDAQQVATICFEHELDESSHDLMKEEKVEELTGAVEMPVSNPTDSEWPQTTKDGPQQQTEEPIVATDNMPVASGKLKDGVSDVIGTVMVKDGSEDIQIKCNLGRTRSPSENHSEQVVTDEQNTATKGFCPSRIGEREFIEDGMTFSSSKLLSETASAPEQVQQQRPEVTLTQAIEKEIHAADASVKSLYVEENHSNEKRCDEESHHEINEENELVTADALRSDSSITVAADELKNISYCTEGVIQTGNECITAPCSPTKNGDDHHLKGGNETVVGKDKVTESITEEMKPVDVKKEECLQLEQIIDEKCSIQSQVGPDCESGPTLGSQAVVIKDSLSLSEGAITAELDTIAGSTSELGEDENAETESEENCKLHNVLNNFQATEVTMEDECLTSKKVEKENGKLLKTTKMGTTHCVAEESQKVSHPKTVCERGEQSCLISGNLQCRIDDALSQGTTNLNNSPASQKCTVKDTETDCGCSLTNKVVSEQNLNEDPSVSMQGVLQTENVDLETISLTMLTNVSESTDVSVSNLEVSSEGLKGSCHNSDTANMLSSLPVSTDLSSPTREDIDHVDHRYSGGNLKGQEASASNSAGNEHNPLDFCYSSKTDDEIKGDQSRKLSTTGEHQTLVNMRDCCSVDASELLTPEASSLNNINTVHISVATRSVLTEEVCLVYPSEKLGSPLRSNVVELTLDEAGPKEIDEILTCEIRSGKVSELKTENTTVVLDSSISDSSEEEAYPLRKVNCTKQRMLREELSAVRNSQAGVPSSMTTSCSDGHESSYVTEEAFPKDKQAKTHDINSSADEAIARMLEHSYSARLTCSSEDAPLKVEASRAIEVAEERQMEQSVSSIASLMSEAFAYNGKSASRKSNGATIAPCTEHRGASEETSEVPAAFYKGKLSAKQEIKFPDAGQNSNKEQKHLTSSGLNTAHNKECHVKKKGKTLAAKTGWNSTSLESKSVSSEQRKVVTENSVSLPTPVPGSQNGSPSDFVNRSAKARVKDAHGVLLQRIPSQKGKKRNQQAVQAEANTEISAPTKYSPKTLTKIRQEMGPPLPPLLPPLIATPPRTVRPISPIMSSSSQSSLPSPLDGLISPLHDTPVPPLMSPLTATPKHKSTATFTTPSPSETAIGHRTLSSPLQFCAATPKHALPVPGRLPPSAAGSAAPPVSQENSVKILDSMYPELSPLARTLNILKGNIQLSRPSSLDGENIPRPVHQISGFKAIASKNTAFVKTGTNFKPDPEQPLGKAGKRTLASMTVPKSAKRLRLDKSPKQDLCKEEVPATVSDADVRCPANETTSQNNGDTTLSTGDCGTKLLLPVEETEDPDSSAVALALEKMSQSCFDLLPVIRSHFFVNNTPKVPVMRDEERDVIYEFAVAKKHLAEPALEAILKKLKKQKSSLGHNCVQALCRVYVGICRQLGDMEKARLFCYSLLKEGFPKSDKLTLFIGNTWSEIFSSESVINKAILLVVRQCASGEMLKYLKAYLNWEESTPVDFGVMVSSLLLAMQLCPQMEFQLSEEYGEDLKESTWEYVFAIDLLCSHQKWPWTHDNIISKELWPLMNTWIKNRMGNGNVSSPSDTVVATVLRLIGRLGQIGLRGGFFSAVKSISSVVGAFLQHSREKDLPWGVQLAAAYALCDLGPSNPSGVLEAFHAWKVVNTNSLPPAVTRGIAEVSSLLKCAEKSA